jgi:hypothetical protein
MCAAAALLGVFFCLGNRRLVCFSKEQQSCITLLRVHVMAETDSTARLPGHPIYSQLFVPHNNIPFFENHSHHYHISQHAFLQVDFSELFVSIPVFACNLIG